MHNILVYLFHIWVVYQKSQVDNMVTDLTSTAAQKPKHQFSFSDPGTLSSDDFRGEHEAHRNGEEVGSGPLLQHPIHQPNPCVTKGGIRKCDGNLKKIDPTYNAENIGEVTAENRIVSP